MLIAMMLAAAAAGEPPRDWASLLRTDAQALHAAYVDSHPGGYPGFDPAVRRTLDQGLAKAHERARAVKDYPGYHFALREYSASFNDGHVQLGPASRAPSLPARWPGFIAVYEDGQLTVTEREDEAAPPVGAVLRDCEGRDAPTLGAENVGRFRNLWSLTAGQRGGWRVFYDEGNPFIRLPQTCTFEVGGQPRTYRLTWREGNGPDLVARAAKAISVYRAPIERRPFGDGGVWISLGSFESDPASEPGKQLAALIPVLRREQDQLRQASRIVLDLRGNGGGSSDWSVQIAHVLWGEAWVKAKEPAPGEVDWRASAANIAHFEDVRRRIGEGGAASAENLAWLDRVIAGMKTAQAEGKPFWREREEGYVRPSGPARAALRGRVFVLTDGSCGSACLDAVDLWLPLGATIVGRETAADTVYMDIRMQELPSGLTRISVPTKAYRNRPRGSNETYKPVHRFAGDMADTAALERWIAALP